MKQQRIAAMTLVGLAGLTLVGVAVGCKDKNSTDPAMRSEPPAIETTAVSSSAAPTPAATPAPAPQYTPAPQPVVYDSTPAPTPASTVAAPAQPVQATAAASGASSRYKIRKGDTLYSIARTYYGDGKQYPRIVAANPGLSADHLVTGKTIVIP